MAAAAKLPHLFGVTSSSWLSSSSDAPASAQNGAFLSENVNRGIQASAGFLSKAKDLCRNTSLAISSFVGAPVKRVFRQPSLGYQGKFAPWISAQAVSNKSTSNNSDGFFTSKKADTAPSVANEPRDGPSVVSQSESKRTALMSHVSNLIKLVNSKDIVELELKHTDYELLIRKKEALPAPPPPPVAPMPQFFPGLHTPFPTIPQEPARPYPTPGPAAPPTEEVQAAPKQDTPPMLSPMAGTFYHSPAPGEPAFVKVGDKVQKGQVVCIVEAMKLMNEIEADQSGTIVEILADDGTGVSIETPLFIIKP